MGKYIGDFAMGATVHFNFNTAKADGTPVDLLGSPVLSIYKDGGTTEFTGGLTLTVAFDSRTGLHHVAIDTSNSATNFSAGSEFSVVITTGTVDSVSQVGVEVGCFSVQRGLPYALTGLVTAGATPSTTTFECTTTVIAGLATSAIVSSTITFTSGTNKGLTFRVSAFNTTTNILTVSAMPVAPTAGDTFILTGRQTA